MGYLWYQAPDHTTELGLYDPALTHAPSIGKPLPQQSYQGSTLIPCPINWFCVVLIFKRIVGPGFNYLKKIVGSVGASLSPVLPI